MLIIKYIISNLSANINLFHNISNSYKIELTQLNISDLIILIEYIKNPGFKRNNKFTDYFI